MLNIDESVVIVIDVQTRLAHFMHDHEQLHNKIERIIKVAHILNLPIICTEQAPDKIGPTDPSVATLLSEKPISKRSFSAWGCEAFVNQLQALKRKQVILVGIETHVCVYQTAADLKEHGFDVFVAADAVSSRSQFNSELTLSRMRHEHITVTVAESIICELIKTADHPKFRDVMAYIK